MSKTFDIDRILFDTLCRESGENKNYTDDKGHASMVDTDDLDNTDIKVYLCFDKTLGLTIPHGNGKNSVVYVKLESDITTPRVIFSPTAEWFFPEGTCGTVVVIRDLLKVRYDDITNPTLVKAAAYELLRGFLNSDRNDRLFAAELDRLKSLTRHYPDLQHQIRQTIVDVQRRKYRKELYGKGE